MGVDVAIRSDIGGRPGDCQSDEVVSPETGAPERRAKSFLVEETGVCFLGISRVRQDGGGDPGRAHVYARDGARSEKSSMFRSDRRAIRRDMLKLDQGRSGGPSSGSDGSRSNSLRDPLQARVVQALRIRLVRVNRTVCSGKPKAAEFRTPSRENGRP